MATLKVKNVGPIRDAELEVKKHTVFIGPQGSGKSTLAKLISLFSSLTDDTTVIELLDGYNIETLIQGNSKVQYSTSRFKSILQSSGINTDIYNEVGSTVSSRFTLMDKNTIEDWPSGVSTSIENLVDQLNGEMLDDKFRNQLKLLISNALTRLRFDYDNSGFIDEIYIPTERTLIATLSKSIWSLIDSDVNIPKIISRFAKTFELARNHIGSIKIPFLNISYQYSNGNDIVHQGANSSGLGQSASGYQSIIPLIMVIENQRREINNRFIIEEPELNLYPTAQKDLLYALVGGLQPDGEYHEAEWVITTHSPYVLIDVKKKVSKNRWHFWGVMP